MAQTPFGTSNFAENPEPRLPCVLLLDVSGSMDGAPIAELNSGVVVYRDELAADPLASKRVEVAIITFGRSGTYWEMELEMDEVMKSVHESLKVWTVIESRLETLLGDYQGKAGFKDIDTLLSTHGVAGVEGLTLAEKLEKACDIIRKKPTGFEQTRTALDLILCARYGYTSDKLDKMTAQEILLAIDHACGYDEPTKPSIWSLTK